MGDISPNEFGNLDHTTAAQERLNVSVSIDINTIVQSHLEHLPCLPIERKIDMLEALLDEIRKWQSPPTLSQLVEQAEQQIARGEWEEGGLGGE